MAETEKNKGGRPTDYKPAYNTMVKKLCLLGATDKEIADFFEVSEVTINAWKEKHPKFLNSVRDGRVKADSNVAKSFYKRAIGYKYTEETHEKGIHTKTVIKELPPDPGAALNWLKNRQPDKWRDKKEFEHSGKIAADIDWLGGNEQTKPQTEGGS